MRIANFTPFLLLGTAYALPTLFLPWFGQVRLDCVMGYLGYSQLEEERTVYQLLKEDENFSRLVKAIELSDSVVEFLDDPSQNITFFAVPNSGLPKPRKPGRYHNRNIDQDVGGDGCHNHNDLDLLVLEVEQLDHLSSSVDKERRRRCLARIVRGVLAYHILPDKYSSTRLLENSTYATNLTLKDGSMDYQPLRISVQGIALPPGIRINAVVSVTKRNIEVKNGIIHHINKPLLPPPSLFQEAFLFPKVFSYVTSAIQRVGLTGQLDRRYFHGGDGSHGGFHGAKAATFFAPTSFAFQRLPKKLQLFLFSPFGERALRKLLEFHIVPDFVLFSDYTHNATSEDHAEDQGMVRFIGGDLLHTGLPVSAAFYENDIFHHGRKRIPPSAPVYEYDITLPTLLANQTLDVHVARYTSTLPIPGSPLSFTRFKVNGRNIVPFDFPARNGALHVLNTLLNPRHHHHHRHHRDHEDRGDGETLDTSWDDWEEWLPQWAMED